MTVIDYYFVVSTTSFLEPVPGNEATFWVNCGHDVREAISGRQHIKRAGTNWFIDNPMKGEQP